MRTTTALIHRFLLQNVIVSQKNTDDTINTKQTQFYHLKKVIKILQGLLLLLSNYLLYYDKYF